ncbi:MAG: hypothetical protein ACYDBV_08450, partial [Nitrospiria bacterium]
KQAGDSIYYVDEQELPLLIHDVIHNRERVTGHGFSSELEEEETSTHVKNKVQFETCPPQDKERKILEKLDRLGVIRKK